MKCNLDQGSNLAMKYEGDYRSDLLLINSKQTGQFLIFGHSSKPVSRDPHHLIIIHNPFK